VPLDGSKLAQLSSNMAIVTPAESSVAAVPVSVSRVPHSGDEVVLAMTISQYTPVTTASAKASARAGVIVTPALVTPCGRLRTARVKPPWQCGGTPG